MKFYIEKLTLTLILYFLIFIGIKVGVQELSFIACSLLSGFWTIGLVSFLLIIKSHQLSNY